MSEDNPTIRAASQELDYSRSRSRLLDLRVSVEARVRRRKQARLAVFAGAPLILAGLGLAWQERDSERLLNAPAASVRPQLESHDGSRIELLTASSRARVVRDEAHAVAVELSSGAARFRVQPNLVREFSVHSAGFEVKVLGTTFVVAHVSDGIEVKVEAGRVSVQGPDVHATLDAGQLRRFVVARPAAPRAATSVTDVAPPSGVSAQPRPSPDWRALAKAHQYAQAYAALKSTAHGPALSADELWLRADVARLSGHPAEAVEPLRSLVQRFSADSRVPSAWFTLAGLEEQLGRPARAAEAFARSRGLQPGGPLAEDALGREALALLKAGSRAAAESRAREYLKRYPAGVRAAELKRRFELP